MYRRGRRARQGGPESIRLTRWIGLLRRSSELRQQAALRARFVERQRHQRPEIPLVRHVDIATRSAMDRPQHFFRNEVAGLRRRHRGDLDAVVELQEHELDEKESVIAPVTALEAALLDLAERRRI